MERYKVSKAKHNFYVQKIDSSYLVLNPKLIPFSVDYQYAYV